MTSAHARTWKKIGLFYALVLAISSVFWVLDVRAPGNLTLITGLMWTPALAAVLTKWMFGESPRDFGWTWGSGKFQSYGYLLPLVYAVPAYVVVWLTGLGGFYDTAFLEKTAKDYGLSALPSWFQLSTYIFLAITVGFIPKIGRALGEEIGWRGFLVPELSKVTGITGIGLISGLMWAAWHYPVILFSDYNAGTPSWYALTCFTVMVVAVGFIAAWLRLKSNSLWPAAVLHASHNTVIQLVLTPLTTNTGHTAYLIDEFGAGLAITATAVAIMLWLKSGTLSLAPAEPVPERARA